MSLLQSIAAKIYQPPLTPDRGGYTVTMREDLNTAVVLNQLLHIPGPVSRLHIGWGSFRNLDIAAVRLSSFILLCDINQHQINIWQCLAKAITACDTKHDFIALLAETLPKNPRLRQFHHSTLEWLQSDFDRSESWLYDGHPERFEFIRSLFFNDAFAVTSLDLRIPLTHQSPFLKLKGLLKDLKHQQGAELDTLYISNIPYMLKQPKGFFGEPQLMESDNDSPLNAYQILWHNLSLIAGPNTHLINAEYLSSNCQPDDLQWVTRLEAAQERIST